MPWPGASTNDIEIAVAHRVEPGTGRHDLLRYMQPDLAPLVDQPGRDVFVGLVDVAVEEFEGEPLGPGLLQQPLGLFPRLLDVGPIASELLPALPWLPPAANPERRCRRPFARWRSSTGRRAVPTVDRQGQCAAHPGIIERFALVIRGHRAGDVPIALLDLDLVAERLDQFVARRGRHAAELDRRAVGADRLDPHRLLVGIDASEAVKIRQTYRNNRRSARP